MAHGLNEVTVVVEQGSADPLGVEVAELSPRQGVAIGCFARGASIAEVVEATGVSRATLHRWRTRDPKFRAAMNMLQNQAIESAQTRMAMIADDAMGALAAAVKAGNAKIALEVLRDMKLTQPPRRGAESVEGAWEEQRSFYISSTHSGNDYRVYRKDIERNLRLELAREQPRIGEANQIAAAHVGRNAGAAGEIAGPVDRANAVAYATNRGAQGDETGIEQQTDDLMEREQPADSQPVGDEVVGDEATGDETLSNSELRHAEPSAGAEDSTAEGQPEDAASGTAAGAAAQGGAQTSADNVAAPAQVLSSAAARLAGLRRVPRHQRSPSHDRWVRELEEQVAAEATAAASVEEM